MRTLTFVLIFLSAFVAMAADNESCVKIGETRLFCLKASDGNLAPEQRANLATRALEDIMTDPDGELDSIQVVEKDSIYSIVYQGLIQKKPKTLHIIRVIPEDTVGTGISVSALADKWYWDIRKGISSERQRSWSFDNLAKLALGILFPFLVLILYYLIDKAYRAMSKSVVRREGVSFHGVRIGKMEIIPARLQVSIILKFLLVLKWVIIALALYAMIYVFFTLFPTTQQYSEILLNTSLEWLKKLGEILVDVAKFAIAGLVLYLIARILWAIVDMVFRHYEDAPDTTKIPDAAISPLKRLFKAVIVMAFLIALVAVIPGPGEYLAFGLFILTGVFLGIAALPYIGSVFAGIAMLLARKIQIGDRILVHGVEGKVESMGVIWTRILTDKDEELVLFNTKVVQATVLIEKNGEPVEKEKTTSEEPNE